ncbi:RNA-dependent ATPase rok1 [Sorochytrium milnesiophthora]
MDFFRTLTSGARFNKERFRTDVAIFEGDKPQEATNDEEDKALDFFGDGSAMTESTDIQQEREEAESNDSDNDQVIAVPMNTVEQISLFRSRHQIRTYGDNVPPPFQSFQELATAYEVPEYLLANVKAAGYRQPTPIQMQAFPIVASGRDILACAPTGSGKTLAYLLSLLHLLQAPKKVGFRACIIAPTRELAQQIQRELHKLTVGRKWKSCVLSKATPADAGTANGPKFDILISTPLRLVHAVKQGTVQLDKVEHLVLDEADKLLDLGFLEQVDEIIAACSLPRRQTSLFSATLAPNIEALAKTVMKVDVVRIVIGVKNAAASTIDQSLVFVGDEAGKLVTFRQSMANGEFKPPALVFVQSVARAKELFHELVYEGINVDVIHAERTKLQRDNIVEQFRLGRIWVLICTDVLSRGIDFKGVNCVVNYDFPTTTESYVHRVGRTGRAGREGKAVTYFTKDDAAFLRSIVNVMRESGCQVPEWMLKLKKVPQDVRKRVKIHGVKRQHIDTTPKYDIEKAKERRAATRGVGAAKRQKTSRGVKDEDK